MPACAAHRFTVDEYYRMAETGLLKPDARVELLDGQIIDTEPIGPFHGGTTNRLSSLFIRQAKDRWIVSVQNPVHLDQHSEPQPDLMLLKPREDYYCDAHPGPDDVFLLIEVAESSLDYDRGKKLSAYGRAGIREVWIINLPDKSVEVYSEPHYLGYESKTILRAGD